MPTEASVENCCTELDPDSVATWYIDGKQPKAGQIFKNPDLAKTFRILQAQGPRRFLQGPGRAGPGRQGAFAGRHHDHGRSRQLQGRMDRAGDERLSRLYLGGTAAAVPRLRRQRDAEHPGGLHEQGLSGPNTRVPGAHRSALLASSDRGQDAWPMPISIASTAIPISIPGLADKVKALVGMAHAQELCAKISPDKAIAMNTGNASGNGDTIVLSAADRWGNMVSWVNSNYANFGSGITVPGYGFILHNRGSLFTLDPNSPNVIAPHKRPYNTLAAAFVLQGGRTDGQLMALQLMGGDMQSQGHAQVMVDMVDLGANLQAASDMARFHHNQVRRHAWIWNPKPSSWWAPQLQAMGHKIRPMDGSDMGGFQAILMTPDPKEPSARRQERLAAARSTAPIAPAPITARTAFRSAGNAPHARRLAGRNQAPHRYRGHSSGDARRLARGSGRPGGSAAARRLAFGRRRFRHAGDAGQVRGIETRRLQISYPGGRQPGAGHSRRDGRIDGAGRDHRRRRSRACPPRK